MAAMANKKLQTMMAVRWITRTVKMKRVVDKLMAEKEDEEVKEQGKRRKIRRRRN
jgi:mannitol/fructose-specific phosphotransferase system IIA component